MATTMPADRLARGRWTTERRFYTGMALAILAAVFVGFADTYYLMHFFPAAAAHGAPEAYFFWVHGAVFTAWFVLLVVQAALLGVGRTDVHRLVGYGGAVLALAVVATGLHGALIAAARPTGFVDVPVPPAQFLIVPLLDMVLFAIFVALAIAKRADPQSHKRLLLLASIALLTAAIVRWPVDFGPALIVAGFVLTDLFIVPLAIRDWRTRGKLHPVTLWGGLAIVVSQPLRLVVSGTPAWQAVAESLLRLGT